MATFRKRNGRWNVRIRSNHHRTISKTFINKDDAIKYARETEAKIQRRLFEDLEQASQITLEGIIDPISGPRNSSKNVNMDPNFIKSISCANIKYQNEGYLNYLF